MEEESNVSDREEIIIQSDQPTPIYRREEGRSEEMAEGVNEGEGEDSPEVQLVHPHFPHQEEEEEKRKLQKKQRLLEMYEELEEKNKGEEDLRKQVLARRREKEQYRQTQQQLRKQFETHSYLSLPVLQSVKETMQKFQISCKMQTLPKEERSFAKQRQEVRRSLTRVFILAIEQLREKIKSEQLSSLEQDIVGMKTHLLKYCYTMSTDFEKYFFQKIVRKMGKNVSFYQKQLKLVMKLIFNDKNNIEGRRDILNRRTRLDELVFATEQKLMCQQTKLNQKMMQLQLIRQSEKDPLGTQNKQVEAEPPLISFQSNPSFNQPIPSFNSLASSIMDVEPPKESEQQIRLKEAREGTAQCIERFKQCQDNLSQIIIMQDQRMEELKRKYKDNEFFMGICANMRI